MTALTSKALQILLQNGGPIAAVADLALRQRDELAKMREVINEDRQGRQVRDLTAEIGRLRKKIAELESGSGRPLS